MNSAYNQYEQEFSRKTNTIRQKITSLQKLNGGMYFFFVCELIHFDLF